jgi:hypothetical protein
MADINASDNTEEFIAYEETHRHRWKHIDEKVDIQKTKPLLHPDRRNLPSGAYLPAGGKNILLSGDVLRGPRPPGKAMTEKVVASDLGPGVRGVCPRGRNRKPKRGGGITCNANYE